MRNVLYPVIFVVALLCTILSMIYWMNVIRLPRGIGMRKAWMRALRKIKVRNAKSLFCIATDKMTYVVKV